MASDVDDNVIKSRCIGYVYMGCVRCVGYVRSNVGCISAMLSEVWHIGAVISEVLWVVTEMEGLSKSNGFHAVNCHVSTKNFTVNKRCSTKIVSRRQ